jgi:hypothetical protein
MPTIGHVIDNTQPDWDEFPNSLNGHIFLGFGPDGLAPDASHGYSTQEPDDDTAKLSKIEIAVQSLLDSTAQASGYDSILTAVTYVGSPVTKFNAEGIAFRDWRAQCWDTCYQLLAQWQAGDIAEMTPAEVVAALPAYTPPT